MTDEVLAPGYSKYQLSSEYLTYDVKELLQTGSNAIGVNLGNGPAYIRRSVTNPAVGRNSPYARWQSQLKGNGSLVTDAYIGSTSVRLDNTTGYHVGGSIHIHTGRGVDLLESRVVTEIRNTTISFTPGTDIEHEAGSIFTGSGNKHRHQRRLRGSCCHSALHWPSRNHIPQRQHIRVTDRNW